MNYFAHARRFLDNPYFVAGAAVPDWLSILDRRIRARSKGAAALSSHDDPRVAAIAAGVIQHHRDDAFFHSTAAFVQLNAEFAAEARRALAGDESMRPSFVGHVLIEVLLDAELIAEAPERLDAYYEALAALDGPLVEQTVSQIAGRPAERLATVIERFCEARFLYDYLEDGKLLGRLNGVMRRVRLPELPSEFVELLPQARRRVRAERKHLLGE